MFRKAQRIITSAINRVYCISINKSQGIVLMFHRVVPLNYDSSCVKSIQDLCITPQKLQNIIDIYRRDYDFIQLNELETRLINREKHKKPFMVFTFDDGYLDNYEFAFPIFLKNKVPFSVFPSVDFINNERPFNYPFIIEEMVRNNDELQVNGACYSCQNDSEKEATFLKLKDLVLSLPYSNFKNSFFELFNKYIKDNYFKNRYLSWEQLREMQESGLCLVGSHTMSHCKLSSCDSVNQINYELGESKRILEENLNRQIKFISYPFGWINDIDERVIESAKKTGYSMAFISYGGGCRKMDNDLYRVKRLIVK